MRIELLYSPLLFIERLGQWAAERRRLQKLRGTVAAQLTTGHIDSLELLELLRPLNPQAIFDIGANIGTWTILAKALYPETEIYAFEPLESHCAKFTAATRGLQGVTLHQLALGAMPANLQMNVLNRSDASSLLPMTSECSQHFALKDERTVTVRVERLDDLLRAKTIPQPDVVKLDIQGYELEALRGGEVTLMGAHAILAEVSLIELYKEQCLFHGLAAFLAERGFYVCAFGAATILGRPLLQADVLFVSAKAAKKLNVI